MMPDEVDEYALLREQDRGQRAQRLIEDEIFKGAFTDLEQQYMKAWRNTGMGPNEAYVRERWFMAINILGKVHEHFVRLIEGGKFSRRQIEDIEQRRALGIDPRLP